MDVERLYNANYKTVHDLCLRMTHNFHDAEDITQDVFVGIMEKPPNVTTEKWARNWLRQSAKFKCLNLYHRNQRLVYVEELPDVFRSAWKHRNTLPPKVKVEKPRHTGLTAQNYKEHTAKVIIHICRELLKFA